MYVSTEKRLVFVHVPKTGGTSINAALEQSFGPADRRYVRPSGSRLVRLLRRFTAPHQLGKHEFAVDARERMPVGQFDACFSFAFVRNPWDWLVSLYAFITRTEVSPDTGRPWRHALYPMVRTMSFDEFVDWVTVSDGLTLLPGRQRSAFAGVTPVRQRDWITDLDDRVIVDFVGRFEHLDNDVSAALSRFAGAHVGLSHVNVSQRSAYRSYYSPASREAVRRYFNADISSFSYEF